MKLEVIDVIDDNWEKQIVFTHNLANELCFRKAELTNRQQLVLHF